MFILINEARAWVNECQWVEEEEELEELTDHEILLGVKKHYEGGLIQFIRDTVGS